MITLRIMEEQDITAGIALCRISGWNQVYSDWQLFLRSSPKGCFVAVNESGTVIGTAATITYEQRLAWIGMVLVHPDHKRKGIGTRLLLKAIESLEHIDNVKLDATPAGREVYLKLGFADEYNLVRMVRPHESPHMPVATGHPALRSLENSSAIQNTDRAVFGAGRRNILDQLIQRGRPATLVNENGSAYILSRDGHLFTQLGPVVANDIETAKNLVSCAMQQIGGRDIVMDVPRHSSEWVDWLRSNGFQEQRPFIRMYKGKNDCPGIISLQYAIAGPEIG